MKRTIIFWAVVSLCGTILSQVNDTLQMYPFSYDKFWIIAEGTVNDTVTGKFCLDTGATEVALNRKFVDTYAINKKELKEDIFLSNVTGGGVGTGHSGVIWAREAIKCEVGGRVFNNKIYKVYPALEFDALIGIEPKHEFTFEIYYDKGQFRLYRGKAKRDFDKSWTCIRYVDKGTKITVPLKIKIGKKVIIGQFLVDTGASHAIFLTTEAAHQYGLTDLDGLRRWKTERLGLSGASSGMTIMAESVKFGKDEFTNVDVHFASDKTGALADGCYMGIIGNRLLEKYDVVIDYARQRMYIRPNSWHNTLIVTKAKRIVYEE